MRRRLRPFLLLLGACLVLLPDTGVRGSVETLRRHVEHLAAPELEGRMTGTPGEERAAAYLRTQLEALGARPLPGARGFDLPFDFTSGTNDIGSSLALEPAGDGGRRWTGIERVRALSFSDNGAVTAPVVFAGYGLTVPANRGMAYDSYAGIDVEGKVVVVLRYAPEQTSGELRAELARYSGLRYKAQQARDRGARALLVVTGPHSANAGKTVEAASDGALAGSGILAASIGGDVAEALFAGIEGGLSRAQAALDKGDPHATGFDLPGVSVSLEVKIERERRTGRNVVGYLPTSGQARTERYVMLGAHYDHLGRGMHGNSRADKDETGQIHLGADDNASGVAAVLAAGARLAAGERLGPVILAFWSGEELGLLGSSEFIKSPPLALDHVAAYLNFDMVGRMRDNKLNLQGVGSSSTWPRLIEQANVAVGFDVRMQEDPHLPTDTAALYRAGLPVASFFTGTHDDYHRPTDSAEKINYEDLERVAQFAALLTQKLGGLATAPDYVKVQPARAPAGDRDSVRAYTGTIPDYATEVAGLRLSGVVGGGPAERAGLAEGDVIVEFAGHKIANIYDYTYALDAVRIGEPVAVVLLRGGQRLELSITPTARP